MLSIRALLRALLAIKSAVSKVSGGHCLVRKVGRSHSFVANKRRTIQKERNACCVQLSTGEIDNVRERKEIAQFIYRQSLLRLENRGPY